jgi:hypothetical protein
LAVRTSSHPQICDHLNTHSELENKTPQQARKRKTPLGKGEAASLDNITLDKED